MPWILAFPAFLALLGLAAWYFLRRYRVHPHEGTLFEYATDEKREVVLDDGGSELKENVKKRTLPAKLLQILRNAR